MSDIVQRYTFRMHSRDGYIGGLDNPEWNSIKAFYCHQYDPNPLGGHGYLISEYDDAFWYANSTSSMWSSRLLTYYD